MLRRSLALTAVSLVIVGCKKAPPPAASFTYDVYVESAGAIEGLEVDGKPIAAKDHTRAVRASRSRFRRARFSPRRR